MKDDELLALAGIWRLWYAPDGRSQIESFAIITTEPNELMVEKLVMIVCRQSSSGRTISAGLSPTTRIALLSISSDHSIQAK